jgi:hypothetical protein
MALSWLIVENGSPSEQLSGFVTRLKALPIDTGPQTPLDVLGLTAICAGAWAHNV